MKRSLRKLQDKQVHHHLLEHALPSVWPPFYPFDTDTFPPEKTFSVWTSMLNRTRETAEYFDEEIYACKAMRMLDEIVVSLFLILIVEPRRMRRAYPRGNSTAISWRVRTASTWQTTLSIQREWRRKLSWRNFPLTRRYHWNWTTSNPHLTHCTQSRSSNSPCVLS
jgi:hypothetical protein